MKIIFKIKPKLISAPKIVVAQVENAGFRKIFSVHNAKTTCDGIWAKQTRPFETQKLH